VLKNYHGGFIGTSNSVGVTYSILGNGLRAGKEIIAVDPSPSKTFEREGVKIIHSTAIDFCRSYFG
jgi:hypothetical protein